MLKDRHHTSKLSAVEKDIDAAIERVHAVYGTDLAAFFKKVQREVQANPQRPSSRNPPRENDRHPNR